MLENMETKLSSRHAWIPLSFGNWKQVKVYIVYHVSIQQWYEEYPGKIGDRWELLKEKFEWNRDLLNAWQVDESSTSKSVKLLMEQRVKVVIKQ